MARLEELKPGVTVKGILPDGFISVVNVSWIGSVAIELTYFYAFKQVAETLSKAKNTSVQGLTESGIVKSRSGAVQLLGAESVAG
ncbi:MAG: hypothetical protein R6V15_03925 [Desulfotignum sp.]